MHTIRENITRQLSALDAALESSVPALLTLLDVPVADPFWLTLEPSQRRQRTLDAVTHLLLRESQVAPLLVVFEDVHWIDSETQAVLDRLVDTLAAARLFLLATYRPEYQHQWGNKACYTQLRLDPLSPTSARELLRDLVGENAGLQPLKRLLLDRTQGNPFFLEESIQTLIETRVLGGERGAYYLARDLPQVQEQVPASVQAVPSARIDRLPVEDKRVLQTHCRHRHGATLAPATDHRRGARGRPAPQPRAPSY